MNTESLDRRAFLSRAGAAALLVPTVGGLSLLTGCAGDPRTRGGIGEGKSLKISTALGFADSFLETYVASVQGFWAKRGLDVTIQGGQGTASALQSVLGGSAGLSRIGAITAIVAAADRGAEVVGIGTVYQRSQFTLASLAERPISDPAQLAGKRVGVVSSAGTTENLLDVMLAKAGVDRESVKRPVTGIGPAAYQLAKDGKIDAWIMLDTDVANLRRKGSKIEAINTDDVGRVPSDTYTVRRADLAGNADKLAAFLGGILEALEFAADEKNFDKVVAAVHRYNKDITPEKLKIRLPLEIERWQAAGPDKLLQIDPAAWNAGITNLNKAGLIKNRPTVEKLTDTKPLQKAKNG